ncbi:type I-C CRISPR-associated protein Cas7/Csd2 [Porphyromonas sp. COT-239 OH1446]|uniref:type I-C CRISPR-associated protein Cas7/Csd2 n=1 Tax=Porphyromonas sp. COT-239 OH1446 TaxID=1515613 RepID=UPI00052C3DEF|nr:type I-C CRISPR-associated protein Cas7/Csd2 [Porphyromonas sp. COT-239 OH1446]KGN72214.1 CRISPR-associated protein Csh2 [Porphyromonas sp. COT-239 OH1446]
MESPIISNRYDFLYFFDVQDGNPNGDPDAGNLPRLDFETGQGLVTDVCLKRKVRNYIELVREELAPEDREFYKIFIREKAILNQTIAAEYDAAGGKSIEDARARMCAHYYDVRTFGAVMSTGEKGKNAGQVRGAIQLTFARSIDQVFSSEHTITRMAVATEKEAKDQSGDNRTMGRKATIPYGLYRTQGFISAALAKDTKFSEQDLELFWRALQNMFDVDRSAARGLMAARKLIVFKHQSKLGNAPAHKLFDLIKVERKAPDQAPRSFDDYIIKIDREGLPQGVEILELI